MSFRIWHHILRVIVLQQYVHFLTCILLCHKYRKNISGVIFSVIKYLNIYVPRSTMYVVYPLKFPSYALMTCSESFKFNPNFLNRSCPQIISYLPLAESSRWHFHVTTLVVLCAVKVKSTLTLILVVIFQACV